MIDDGIERASLEQLRAAEQGIITLEMFNSGQLPLVASHPDGTRRGLNALERASSSVLDRHPDTEIIAYGRTILRQLMPNSNTHGYWISQTLHVSDGVANLGYIQYLGMAKGQVDARLAFGNGWLGSGRDGKLLHQACGVEELTRIGFIGRMKLLLALRKFNKTILVK